MPRSASHFTILAPTHLAPSSRPPRTHLAPTLDPPWRLSVAQPGAAGSWEQLGAGSSQEAPSAAYAASYNQPFQDLLPVSVCQNIDYTISSFVANGFQTFWAGILNGLVTLHYIITRIIMGFAVHPIVAIGCTCCFTFAWIEW